MTVRILIGDMRERLRELPDNSVDSVVCDPPYHLTSIVKRFGSENAAPAQSKQTGVYARSSKGFMGQTWDGGDVAFQPETWAEVFRVLKPGGHLLAFSSTRGGHRMICAIEDAGFEIRDCLGWIFGSGFPKSLDVSKALDKAAGAEREVISSREKAGDITGGRLHAGSNEIGVRVVINETAPATDAAKQWEGWGTALKPAWENICLARKPLSEKSVAANVLKWGTGAINIDGCRVPADADPKLDLSPASVLCGLDALPRSVLEQPAYSSVGKVPLRIDEHAWCIRNILQTWDGCALGLEHLHANGEVCVDCSSSIPDLPSGCPACRRSGDELLHQIAVAVREPFPRQGDAPEHSALLRLEWQRTRANLCSAHLSIWDDFLGCVSYDTYIQQHAKWQTKPAFSYPNGAGGSDPNHMWRGREKGDGNKPQEGSPLGRWPANLVHDGSDEVVAGFPESDGQLYTVKPHHKPKQGTVAYGDYGPRPETPPRGDSGSAARFFYCAKATTEERGEGNNHPTVKPVALMQWLVRLVTPKGGTCLDPFMGSGSTALACDAEQFEFIGCELSLEYAVIAEKRVRDAAGMFADVQIAA